MGEIPKADTSDASHEQLNQPQVFHGFALSGLIPISNNENGLYSFNMRVDLGDHQVSRQVMLSRSLNNEVTGRLHPGREVSVTGVEYVAKRKTAKGTIRRKKKILAKKVEID